MLIYLNRGRLASAILVCDLGVDIGRLGRRGRDVVQVWVKRRDAASGVQVAQNVCDWAEQMNNRDCEWCT